MEERERETNQEGELFYSFYFNEDLSTLQFTIPGKQTNREMMMALRRGSLSFACLMLVLHSPLVNTINNMSEPGYLEANLDEAGFITTNQCPAASCFKLHLSQLIRRKGVYRNQASDDDRGHAALRLQVQQCAYERNHGFKAEPEMCPSEGTGTRYSSQLDDFQRNDGMMIRVNDISSQTCFLDAPPWKPNCFSDITSKERTKTYDYTGCWKRWPSEDISSNPLRLSTTLSREHLTVENAFVLRWQLFDGTGKVIARNSIYSLADKLAVELSCSCEAGTVFYTNGLRHLLLIAGFNSSLAFSLILALLFHKILSGESFCFLIYRFRPAMRIHRFLNAYLLAVEKIHSFKPKKRSLPLDSCRSAGFHVTKLSFYLPILLAVIVLPRAKGEGHDLRQHIIDGDVNCINYDDNHGIFSLVCSQFELNKVDYITLEKNEVFQGNGNEIVLDDKFSGCFRISSTTTAAPSSLDDAPVIQNLDMIGGETDGTVDIPGAGFIIQAGQRHFIVDSCSSSGEIKGRHSGGICGSRCSGDILITNCSSSGDITGLMAGGITGPRLGKNGNVTSGKVQVTLCHSEGDTIGSSSGGICGSRAGQNGHVAITYSYSTGKIEGINSGGICGWGAGIENGFVAIEQCYSEGDISGPYSGGITGRRTGAESGIVRITDSYSRGDITAENFAGGICGSHTGDDGGTVTVTNVYSSGKIDHKDAGGIIGEIYEDAKEVNITMSVYNDGPIVGRNNADTSSFTRKKNSGNLTDITGKVYCYNGECWNSESIWQLVENDVPILRSPPTSSPRPAPSASPGVTPKDYERRQDVIDGKVKCIQYDGHARIFTLVCSKFDPENSSDFSMNDYITMENNEVFEGNGSQIALNGKYKGLFRTNSTSPSLNDAPTIRNLHMIGGETETGGGFIIQQGQSNFIVDSCSSSGGITGSDSGGMCGKKCSGNILIKDCWSSGDITGSGAGGIAAGRVGAMRSEDTTKVQITHCHSTGNAFGINSGGICGIRAGENGGQVVITHSYSTGEIGGPNSGGICGFGTAHTNGIVTIQRCYSEGKISGQGSGGIIGRGGGTVGGTVRITNSYSRGDTRGDLAGGISGSKTGWASGTVIITNVYASGKIDHTDAGGIIGQMHEDAREVNITMSVYNDGPIVGNEVNPARFTSKKTSRNLTDITAKVYCYENECWNSTIWLAVPNNFPILAEVLGPSPLSLPTPSATTTGTPKPTQLATPTSSQPPQHPTPMILPAQYPRRSAIDTCRNDEERKTDNKP